MQKDFDKWNSEKKVLDRKRFRGYVHEREVWWTAIGVNVGFEEDGKNQLFERPVLVLKKFNHESILVVPLTSKAKDGRYYISFGHAGVTYVAIISQIRLISTRRLLRKIYTMDERVFATIRDAVKSML